MQPQKKINILKYLAYSAFPYLGGAIGENTREAYLAYGIIFLCVIVNHAMLLYVTSLMIYQETKADSGKILILFLLKAGILFIGISAGVHFIGNKVIIPVLFYVYQIFVLIYSMRKA